jgi:DNA processing protein
MHDRTPGPFHLTDADRINRLRLIRSDNTGPEDISLAAEPFW